MRASWADRKFLKNRCFEELSSLILCNNNKPFLCWIVTRNEEWILYDNQRQPAWWMDQEAPKHLPRPNMHQKRSSHCSAVCCLSDPLQFSESRRNHYIWEVCSANRWDAPKPAMPAAGIAQQKGPNSFPWQRVTTRQVAQPALQKLNVLDYSHQPATTSSSASMSFCRENAFTTSRRQKMPSKSSSNPNVWIFALQE